MQVLSGYRIDMISVNHNTIGCDVSLEDVLSFLIKGGSVRFSFSVLVLKMFNEVP